MMRERQKKDKKSMRGRQIDIDRKKDREKQTQKTDEQQTEKDRDKIIQSEKE